MINLIPPGAQKKVKHEYWIRVVSVWLMLGAIAFLMITILNIPAYLLVKNQLEFLTTEYQSASDDKRVFAELSQELRDANNIGTLLRTQKETYLFSEIITEIKTQAPGTVILRGFTIRRDDGGIISITVRGQSASRNTLASFRDAIEASDMFESAELPLSNLAKDKDIPFNISIIPTKNISE